jgi:hypothetical protein
VVVQEQEQEQEQELELELERVQELALVQVLVQVLVLVLVLALVLVLVLALALALALVQVQVQVQVQVLEQTLVQVQVLVLGLAVGPALARDPRRALAPVLGLRREQARALDRRCSTGLVRWRHWPSPHCHRHRRPLSWMRWWPRRCQEICVWNGSSWVWPVAKGSVPTPRRGAHGVASGDPKFTGTAGARLNPVLRHPARRLDGLGRVIAGQL